jgi:DNA topoisomerase-2
MTKKTLEETYKKLTQREHILHRGGMYIGSVKKQMEELWIANDTNDKKIKMEKKMIEYSPGFMKIFDEILTNATDHSTRDKTVTIIKVDYDVTTGEISVTNNGTGIPVELHKEHNMYIYQNLFSEIFFQVVIMTIRQLELELGRMVLGQKLFQCIQNDLL